jgi:uroporphyrinogen decarboxylase
MQPDFARLKKAMRHEEADRVPLAEGTIAYEIQSRFLGREITEADLAGQVEFWSQAGYEHFPLTIGMMNPGEVTKASAIVGVVERLLKRDEKGEKTWSIEERGVITNQEDFEKFPWEEAAKIDLSKFWEVQPFLPQGMKILAFSGKVFTLPWMLMGFQNLCLSLYLQEDLVAKVIKKVGEIQLGAVRQILQVPKLGGIWAIDDLSFGSGPMIDPKLFRRYVFPWYEEMASLCRKNDLLFFFHSDGNIWPVLDDLIAIGIDAIHPIDPTCMNIREVKERVGKKVGIIGNIDTDLLARGTSEEVRELTKKRLREIAPGGGYALGSGNSVPNWARFENYQAMRETALKYGTYPLNI